jgi:hypothetical protein
VAVPAATAIRGLRPLVETTASRRADAGYT